MKVDRLSTIANPLKPICNISVCVRAEKELICYLTVLDTI